MEKTVYVRVNHREMRKIDRAKNPGMWKFLTENFGAMLEKLNEDIAKVKEMQKGKEDLVRMKLSCPYVEVNEEEWEDLKAGFGKEVQSMTICFASNMLICDVRLKGKLDRIKESMKVISGIVQGPKSSQEMLKQIEDYKNDEAKKLADIAGNKGKIIQQPGTGGGTKLILPN
jgi:hypothetical protein